MVNWLRSVETILVFHRKALKHCSTVPLFQKFRPWFWVCIHIIIKQYFSMNSEPFNIFGTAKCGQKAKYFIAEYNIVCSAIRYTQGIMNCDVTPTSTVFFLLGARCELVSLFILLMFNCLKKWGYRWNQQNFFYLLVYLARNVQVVQCNKIFAKPDTVPTALGMWPPIFFTGLANPIKFWSLVGRAMAALRGQLPVPTRLRAAFF